MNTSMATVRLRGPLKQMAGGCAEHEVEGETVAELLRALEREQPALDGWILDERGRVRRHINVFVAGEPGSEETAVRPGDAVDVLPAISGGAW
jgi:molybdopterin converting factor small subunit